MEKRTYRYTMGGGVAISEGAPAKGGLRLTETQWNIAGFIVTAGILCGAIEICAPGAIHSTLEYSRQMLEGAVQMLVRLPEAINSWNLTASDLVENGQSFGEILRNTNPSLIAQVQDVLSLDVMTSTADGIVNK